MKKTILLHTTLTGLNTTATTFDAGTQFSSDTSNQYSHCDVLAVVNTLTGTVSIGVNELFGSAYHLTARAAGINATGTYFLTYDNNNQAGPYAAPGTQQNAMLGKGMAKQIVTTAAAGISALNADVYFVFWSD